MDKEALHEDIQTFAGHLLAELDKVKDDMRLNLITTEEYRSRVRAIRRRARSGDGGYLRSMEEIQRDFLSVMQQADTLKRAHLFVVEEQRCG